MSQKVRSEQSLYEDLIIESIQFYGQDVYYLPRELVNVDKIFLDDVPSHFSDAYKIEMYIENTDGFDGEGDLFTKFGIQLRDQATFVVARRRWVQLIGDNLDKQAFRPREGDVIYLPLSNSLFEIKEVKTESPFYQLSQLPLFRMQCELFEYSDEDFDTGIGEIDVIEREHAYQQKFTMVQQPYATAQLEAVIDVNGSVVEVNVVDGGSGYTTVPNIVVSTPSAGFGYFGASSLNVSSGEGDSGQYAILSNHGSFELFLHPNQFAPTGEYTAMFITGGDESTNGDKRFIFGYDDTGRVVFGTYADGVVVPTSSVLFAGEWNHLAVFVEDQVMKIFHNGTLMDTLPFSFTHDWLSSAGFLVGSSAALTVNGVSWNVMDGWLDELHAQAGIYSQILDERIDTQGELYVPEVEWVSGAYTAYLGHWNGEPAILEPVVDQGSISYVNIVHQGQLYREAPTLTVDSPQDNIGFYRVGEIVHQHFGVYQLRGEVTSWNSETLELQVAHIGSTDGKFHQWSMEKVIHGQTAMYMPQNSEEVNQIQVLNQNTTFDDFEGDFLDFTETNPFGDVF